MFCSIDTPQKYDFEIDILNPTACTGSFKELPIGNEGKIRFQNDLPTLDGDISATRKDFLNFQNGQNQRLS